VGQSKIGAIGVRLARWVTSHGFAFNVDVDLAPFELIVPCGIQGKTVTSLRRLGQPAATAEVIEQLALRFADVFARST
jgi:lipoyl(octanoyl) transferase